MNNNKAKSVLYRRLYPFPIGPYQRHLTAGFVTILFFHSNNWQRIVFILSGMSCIRASSVYASLYTRIQSICMALFSLVPLSQVGYH